MAIARFLSEQQLAQSVSERNLPKRKHGALELGARDIQQQLVYVLDESVLGGRGAAQHAAAAARSVGGVCIQFRGTNPAICPAIRHVSSACLSVCHNTDCTQRLVGAYESPSLPRLTQLQISRTLNEAK